MAKKGWRRSTPYPLVGEQHHNSKLSDESVAVIRRSTESAYALARRYRVSHTCIRYVRDGVTWTHV
jgi:hypothetical protein